MVDSHLFSFIALSQSVTNYLLLYNRKVKRTLKRGNMKNHNYKLGTYIMYAGGIEGVREMSATTILTLISIVSSTTVKIIEVIAKNK